MTFFHFTKETIKYFRLATCLAPLFFVAESRVDFVLHGSQLQYGFPALPDQAMERQIVNT